MADSDTTGGSGIGAWETSVNFAGESTKTYSLAVDTSGFMRGLDEADKAGARFSRSIVGAFEDIAIKGKSLGEVFRSLALSLSQVVLKAAFAPLQQGLGSFFGDLFKGVGFARGGVFQQGTPVPFAKGGVIASSMTFPMPGGLTGLAGERGAEAIVPLARGPDGRLGIAAQGSAGGPNITFNITTADAESFQRSQTQVAAMVARAVSLGQRNL